MWLEKIEVATSGFIEKEKKILEKAKKAVTSIAEDMTKHLEEMGKSLADANAIVWEQEKEMNTMTECPVCHEGKLRVMYGKRFSRYFVSCDAYPKCKNTFGLPQKGKHKVLEEECKTCGLRIVEIKTPRKKPWKLCIKDGFVNTLPAKKTTGSKKKEENLQSEN